MSFRINSPVKYLTASNSFSKLPLRPSPSLLSSPQQQLSGRWPAASSCRTLTSSLPNPTCSQTRSLTIRAYSSASSSSRWKTRQGQDSFAREAKVKGLKSRAAFKLLEMDAKYHFFKRGQMVIDLGFAPGSWSQVALDRTKPNGLVVGIDILPAQPPRGVSSIQGNFLSPAVRTVVKDFIRDSWHRRKTQKPQQQQQQQSEETNNTEEEEKNAKEGAEGDGEEKIRGEERMGYIDMEKKEMVHVEGEDEGRPLVDVVLSDMSEPWPPQSSDNRKNGLSNAYNRMMNTSGIPFRDHAGSMDLCSAALHFASDTLRNGGHFVCKFYQGAEDKQLEKRLKKMFDKVYREKPESSRKESREAYFVAMRRKKGVVDEMV